MCEDGLNGTANDSRFRGLAPDVYLSGQGRVRRSRTYQLRQQVRLASPCASGRRGSSSGAHAVTRVMWAGQSREISHRTKSWHLVRLPRYGSQRHAQRRDVPFSITGL